MVFEVAARAVPWERAPELITMRSPEGRDGSHLTDRREEEGESPLRISVGQKSGAGIVP